MSERLEPVEVRIHTHWYEGYLIHRGLYGVEVLLYSDQLVPEQTAYVYDCVDYKIRWASKYNIRARQVREGEE